MRILLIAHGYPPAAGGGTEIYTESLAQTLRRDFDDEVFVLAREADRKRPEYEVRTEQRHGVEVTLINNTFAQCPSFEATYRNPEISSISARLIDEIQPDVAHIQHLTCLSTEIPEILAKRRIPVFFTLNDYWLLCHRGQLFDINNRRCDGPSREACAPCIKPHAGYGPTTYQAATAVRRAEEFLPEPLAHRLHSTAAATAGLFSSGDRASSEAERRLRHMRDLIRHVDLFLPPSETLRERFVKNEFPENKLRLITQGIDHDLLETIERRLSARLRIGFLGSLIVSKAPDVLLHAFQTLPEDRAELHIWGDVASYHGDDCYREIVEPLLDAPEIHRHAFTPHGEIAGIFSAIDVLVIPSVWIENAPFVIREAFTAGVPVIASNIGGMAEMVEDGLSGLHFSAGDSVDLARVLKRLLDEPDLLPRLRGNLPTMMTIEEDAAQLRELYNEVLAVPRPPRPRLVAVVLNYRTPRDAVLAIRSLQTSSRPVDEIIVVDNASGDDSVTQLSKIEGITLIQTDENLGFSGGSNVGIRAALKGGADLVFLLNADAFVARNTLGDLEDTLQRHPDAGIAGPVVLHRSQPSRVASAGIDFSTLTGRMKHRWPEMPWDSEAFDTCPVAAVSGCAMLVNKEVFDEIGLLDEDYFFSFEEIAFCIEAERAGRSSLVVGKAVAYHAGSASIGALSTDRLYYAARNHLMCARRTAPIAFPLSIIRSSLIIVFNLAHGLRGPVRTLSTRISAVIRGSADGLRSSIGPLANGQRSQ